MKQFPLQQRGITNSRLVLGCMNFGGAWNRDPITKQDRKIAEKAVDAALSSGIFMFDLADIYRMGKSEQILGEILDTRSELREQIVIQSKCGIRYGEGIVPGRYDFSKAHILTSVEGILQRLKTDYLDVLLLHRPDPLLEPEEVAEAFVKLKSSGKVRCFGVSNMSAAQMKFLQNALPDELVVNQLEMSLARTDWLDQGVHVNQKAGTTVNFSEGTLEYCQTQKIQLQAWGPLAQGRFTGRAVENQPENIVKTAELVKQMANEKETSPEAIVLGWLMRHPALIQPVIGTVNEERIMACQDAERQSQLMTREEWYTLYVSSRGKTMP